MTTTAQTSSVSPGQYKVLGTRPMRHDAYDKVTGAAKFGADLNLPGMLHGKVLRSPHSHARIRSIDVQIGSVRVAQRSPVGAVIFIPVRCVGRIDQPGGEALASPDICKHVTGVGAIDDRGRAKTTDDISVLIGGN